MFNPKNTKNSEDPLYLNIFENFSKDDIKYLKNLNPELNNLLKPSDSKVSYSSANFNNYINTDMSNGSSQKFILKKRFYTLILEELKKYFNNKKDKVMSKAISLIINEIILISKIVQENIVLTKFFSKVKKEKFNFFEDNSKTKSIFDKNEKGKNFINSKSSKNNCIINGANINKNNPQYKKIIINKNSFFSETPLVDKEKDSNINAENTHTDNGINKKKINNETINKKDKKFFNSANKLRTMEKKKKNNFNEMTLLKNNKSLIINNRKNLLNIEYNINSCTLTKISKKEINKDKDNKNSIKKHLKFNKRNIEKNAQNSKKTKDFSIIEFINFNSDIFKNIETPDFNIFDLDIKVGKKNILPTIGYYIFNRLGFHELLNYAKFENWCKKLAEGYSRENSYHTDLHASDITQTCLNYFKLGKVNEICNLSKNSKCSLFLSCMCHDYKHPGVNNNYLKETKNILAITYNDSSILENMHIAETFKIINSNSMYNIFDKLDNETYKIIRKEMISCVLATDMSFHGSYVEFMKKQIEGKDESKKESIYQHYMNLLIHSSDISNPTKPFDIYFKWAPLVVNEFYDQGDKEKKLGLNCSCDRNKVTIYQSQLGFINYIELKFFDYFVKVFPKLSFYYETLVNNKNKLIAMEQEEKKKEEKK